MRQEKYGILIVLLAGLLGLNEGAKQGTEKGASCPRKTWQDISDLPTHKTCAVQDSKNNFVEEEKQWSPNIASCSKLTEKPSFPRGEPQLFQPVEERIVYVFSAYFERRPLANGPSVRIIAGGFQEQFNHIGDMYCQVWYRRHATPAVVRAKYEVIYRSIAHGDMWTAHFIYCPLPVKSNDDDLDSIPYAVSVTPEPCRKPTNHLMILNRNPPQPAPTVGFCISAVYGRYKDWVGVSEMFEMWTLLGANEIVIYNLSLSRETDLAVKYYQQDASKNVTVVQWQLPRDMSKTSTFFQRGVLNDCLYRLSHKHRYVSMQDLDEVIVPRAAQTYQELFDIMYTPQRGIYMFQHSYFRRNTSNEEPYLITQSSFWTTREVIPAGKIRCKSIYNALLTYSVDVHYHYALLKGIEEYMVPPEIARLHHYRISQMETFRKDPTIEFVEDRYLEQFKPELVSNIKHAIERIKETF